MPDIPLSPEDQKALSESIKGGGDITVNAPSQHSPWVQGGIDVAKGAGRGVEKGVVGMAPFAFEKETKDWASKYEPGSSQAEQWGELGGTVGANVAPFFAVGPALGAASKITQIPRFSEAVGSMALRALGAGKIGPTGYKAAVAGGKLGQSAGEGALGGAGQSAIHTQDEKDAKKAGENIETGAVEGGTSATEVTAARLAFEALPPAIKGMIAAGTLTASVVGSGIALRDKVGHGHWIPWHALYAAAAPLYAAGRQALKLPSAAVGAGSEWMREKMNPRSEAESQDEIAPDQ